MTQELNFEQQKLVEDNHNLIYAVMKKYNLGMNETEDWYGLLAVGLCKAAMSYNPDKGQKFTTFAHTVLENEVKMALRKKKSRIDNVCSLDEPVSDDDSCVLGDMIEDPEDRFSAVEISEAMEMALSRLSERDKLILNEYINSDAKQKEIAERFGVTQSQVSGVVKKYKDSIREYFVDGRRIIF